MSALSSARNTLIPEHPFPVTAITPARENYHCGLSLEAQNGRRYCVIQSVTSLPARHMLFVRKSVLSLYMLETLYLRR